MVAQIECFLAEWAAVLVGLVVNVGYVLLQLVPMGEHLSTDMAHHLLWLRRLSRREVVRCQMQLQVGSEVTPFSTHGAELPLTVFGLVRPVLLDEVVF